MTHSQRPLPYRLITPDYIPFEHNETLEDYAGRFAESLLAERAIELSMPLFIGGYSLGSAIGMELTKHLPARGIVLIGGFMTSNEIRFIPRTFGRYVSSWLPLWVYRAAEVFIAPAMLMISGLSRAEIKLAGVMYHELARGLFREAYHALSIWKGCAISVPYSRIHGEQDQIIRTPKPGPNVTIIPKAKHLVGQARPGPVNEAIKSFITAVSTGND
jgi:pimeloyl-ACP methyl ester carboxylesterase